MNQIIPHLQTVDSALKAKLRVLLLWGWGEHGGGSALLPAAVRRVGRPESSEEWKPGQENR